ncbi:hypothetical protein J2S09_003792 [Bacillus fengqiuensis]|nr:hypothetical protein [Bacillus fengqiuensis]
MQVSSSFEVRGMLSNNIKKYLFRDQYMTILLYLIAEFAFYMWSELKPAHFPKRK